MIKKENIKVCHMSSVHESEDERIFHKEAKTLANCGYDTYYVGTGKSYVKDKVKIIGVGLKPRNRLLRMFVTSRKVYKKALELDADIYHFHDPELLHYGKKLKKRGKKVIFDSHENTLDQIMEKEWIPSLIRKPLFYLFDKYQRRICKLFDAIISVSPHICEYFQNINDNVVMITNYPKYIELDNSIKKINNNNNVLCFAGGISSQWNHHMIIEALEELGECRYVLMGGGNDEYIDYLKHLPGWKYVDYLGKVSHEKVFDILQSCDIGISLLDYNYNSGGRRGTLGNTKIYEQMMAGLPVICTNFELWNDFINKFHCGICVEPGNLNDLKSAIKYLLSHPVEARQMGLNGQNAVKKYYNWDNEKYKLLELYKLINI